MSLFELEGESEKIYITRRYRLLTIAFAIVGRATTIWESNIERSHEPTFKTDAKKEAKMLGATFFAIAKLEEEQ